VNVCDRCDVQGRNEMAIEVITKGMKYITWEQASTGLSSDLLTDALRAKYCDLLIGKFLNTATFSLVSF